MTEHDVLTDLARRAHGDVVRFLRCPPRQVAISVGPPEHASESEAADPDAPYMEVTLSPEVLKERDRDKVEAAINHYVRGFIIFSKLVLAELLTRRYG